LNKSSCRWAARFVGAPNRSVLIRALLARRSVGHGARGLRRRLEKAEAPLLAVESLVPLAGACDYEAQALFAGADPHHRREGDARGHWRLPTTSSHASKQASAWSSPSAMQVWPPASANRAIKSS